MRLLSRRPRAELDRKRTQPEPSSQSTPWTRYGRESSQNPARILQDTMSYRNPPSPDTHAGKYARRGPRSSSPPPWWWPERKRRNGAISAPCCLRWPLYQGAQRTTLKHTIRSNARALWQLRWPPGQMAASRNKPHTRAQHTTAQRRLPWALCSTVPRIFRTSSAPVQRQHAYLCSVAPQLSFACLGESARAQPWHTSTQTRTRAHFVPSA